MRKDDDIRGDHRRGRFNYSGVRKEPATVQAALRGGMGPLMRQFRKFNSMRDMLKALPEELRGLAVPYDVRLAPGTAPGSDNEVADVNTMYFYVASATVKMVLERQKPELKAAVNVPLGYAFIEEFRFEEAGPQKIERQMNILELTPD